MVFNRGRDYARYRMLSSSLQGQMLSNSTTERNTLRTAEMESTVWSRVLLLIQLDVHPRSRAHAAMPTVDHLH